MIYSVFYKNVDPDTGIWTLPKKICECDSIEAAKMIAEVLGEKDPEPNREYLIESIGKKENLIIGADPTQIEMAWKCHNWMRERKINTVICFSPEEVKQIKEMYEGYGLPHMVAVVSEDREKWNSVDYDLRTGEFDEDSFDVILDVME